MTLEEIKKIAVPACREFRVRRLDLFGSLARDEGTAESDVDLLVEPPLWYQPHFHCAILVGTDHTVRVERVEVKVKNGPLGRRIS